MFPAPTNSLLHHNSAPVLGGQRPGMAKPQQHQQGGGGGGIGRSNRGPAMQQGGGGGVGVLTVSGSHKRGRNNSNSARSPLGPSSSVVNSGRLQEDPDLQSLIHQYSEVSSSRGGQGEQEGLLAHSSLSGVCLTAMACGCGGAACRSCRSCSARTATSARCRAR